MPFCTTRNFSIDMNRDIDGVRLDTLFFRLQITGSRISGDVLPSVGSTALSTVSGTCQSFAQPDTSLFNLTFTWAGVTVSVVALVFMHDGARRIQWVGRFTAAAATTDVEVPVKTRDPKLRPEPLPPSDGDTGTSTGQQT